MQALEPGPAVGALGALAVGQLGPLPLLVGVHEATRPMGS
jgi:hypothetical protein